MLQGGDPSVVNNYRHSTTTVAVKVVVNIIEALDGQKYCAALFIDLSKAFDTVDHAILADRLHKIGLSNQAVNWFSNHLSDRTQCVQASRSFSSFLPVPKGVPQGSILGPLLVCVNNLCDHLSDAVSHLYADDTVIYCSSSSASKSLLLQSAFEIVQFRLTQLMLVLNANQSKTMLFSNGKQLPSHLPRLTLKWSHLINT